MTDKSHFVLSRSKEAKKIIKIHQICFKFHHHFDGNEANYIIIKTKIAGYGANSTENVPTIVLKIIQFFFFKILLFFFVWV